MTTNKTMTKHSNTTIHLMIRKKVFPFGVLMLRLPSCPISTSLRWAPRTTACTSFVSTATESAVTALLPIVDDLERALPSMKKADNVEAVAEGVELIYQKFLKALAGLGVKQIETDGCDFNVDLHEAVAQVPGVPDEQKGRVIDCVEKGYTLNDHVIRHAKVAVGM